MIKIVSSGRRKYDIISETEVKGQKEPNKEIIAKLELKFAPVVNKYDQISESVEEMSKVIGKPFDDWFIKYMKDFIASKYDPDVIKRNIPQIKKFCDEYIESLGINFEDYINRDKVSKTSIFIDDMEIKKIVSVSTYLKLYFIISNDTTMCLPQRAHKEIFRELAKDITDCDIVQKLFKIVSSKIYKYTSTDRYMWEYIKLNFCKTTDIHILSIFYFVVNNILAVCKPESNPIPFIISVVDSSIQWMLRSVYKDAMLYADQINTEDVYSQQGKDNLKTYAYNDTIGRMVLHSYNTLKNVDIEADSFDGITKDASETSIIATYVTFPILRKALNIPYRHLITIPNQHGYLLNVLLYRILPDEFKEKYPTVYGMLLYYNTQKSISKTTYAVKNIPHFTKTFGKFLGMKPIDFVYGFYSSVLGKLVRNNYMSFKTGKAPSSIPMAKLEEDIILFYNDYFDGRLDGMLEEIQTKLTEVI